MKSILHSLTLLLYKMSRVGGSWGRGLWLGGLVALVWAVGATQPAWAAETVFTKNIPMTETDYSTTVNVPKFNPALGTLEQIEISFSSRLKGSVKFESLDAQRSTVTTAMNGLLQLTGPDGTLLTSANPQATRSASLRPFDNVLDYDGPSGGAFDSMVAVDLAETKVLTEPHLLAFFSGPGGVMLTMDTQANVAGSGAGNLALNYTTQASAVITVRYIYQTGESPAIDLEKYTNGADADLPTGPLIQTGQPVTWSYIVRNTGDRDLVNITLVDDKEGTISCPQTTLAIDASMTCTAYGIASLGQYSNTAVVTGETLAPVQTVTDSDPSHYYGVPVSNLCPVEDGILVLPEVTYLGEGSGPYVLPDGYERFVVKRLAPFRFVTDPGVTSGSDQIYTPLNANERVWACTGDCGFPAALRKPFTIGQLGPGITIGAVVLDDDEDDRINSWVADGDLVNPVQTIHNQMMVQNLVFDIPFAADWSFNAVDSVGLLHICLASTTNVSSAGISGEGSAAPQPEELAEAALNYQLFLPITTK
jgi:hypothetical protein